MPIDIDTTRLNGLCVELSDALTAQGQNGDLTAIVIDETRRLVAQIVKFIPPQTQAVGNAAIKRELKSLFSEASVGLIDAVGSEKGIKNIDKFIGGKDGKPLRLRWDHLDPMGERMKPLHRSYLDTRGKVRRGKASPAGEWRARVVVPQGTVDPYIKSVQKRVGRAKASWAQVSMLLGNVAVPAYIKRHFPSPFAISIVHLSDGSFPSVTFGSRSPGVSRQSARIHDAVRVRCEAMAKRIKLIASGYSSDLAKGMKIAARAARTREGGSDAIG